jgi:hypothetical protein
VTSSPRREIAAVTAGLGLLTLAVTWPLAWRLGSIARTDNADGQFAIWNVAWVARTLVLDPLNVFNANIFYPNTGTLAYSEANLGAGFLAIPVYWATGSPYAALNFVVLLSFVLNGTAAYCLCRHLTGDRAAAWIAAIGFAFTPYVFGHLPHIQLLLTAGLPLSLLAFHKIEEQPTAWRGCLLGVTMSAQAYLCAYYAVFSMLMIGYGVLFASLSDARWRQPKYWRAVFIAAGVAIAATIPLFLPFMEHRRDTNFTRPLEAAAMFSAEWQTYLASAAYAHRWMLSLIGRWGELLFPGFVVATCGAFGAFTAWRPGGPSRRRVAFYASLAALAFWASLGPDAGLYTFFYRTIPGFDFLRAPSRLGVLVALSLCVLSAVFLSQLFQRLPQQRAVPGILLAIVIAEAFVPASFRPVPPLAPAYKLLATLPDGPVLELPVYSRQFAFRRTEYMLNSTFHWKPIINAYSDYTPEDFLASQDVLGQFPSPDAFRALEPIGARYAVFHLNDLGQHRADVLARLETYAPYLRRLSGDEQILLYEITGYPKD